MDVIEKVTALIEQRDALAEELLAEKERLREKIADIDATLRALGARVSRVGSSKGAPGGTRPTGRGSMRDRVLAAVREEPGSTCGELAEETGFSTTQVAGALKALRDANLVSATGNRGSYSYFAEDVGEEPDDA